jgi:hypothetical protein
MFVNAEQIQLGVETFITNEIGNKTIGFKKFGISFLAEIGTRATAHYINSLASNPILSLVVFDENHNVNIDEVHTMAKAAIQKSGPFNLMGVIFNESDIDKLYNYIRG